MGNFMGLALTFSLHHKAPHSKAGGFYRIISWQNAEFHDAQSTTNPPGLLLVAPGMKNQLSHSRTNPNPKEKSVGMKLFPPQTQPQTWGSIKPNLGVLNPNAGVHKSKSGGLYIQSQGSTNPNLRGHKSKP